MRRRRELTGWAPLRSAARSNELFKLKLLWFGNIATIKELHKLLKNFAPIVSCPRNADSKCAIEGLKSTLGYDNSSPISSIDRSGGIGIF